MTRPDRIRLIAAILLAGGLVAATPVSVAGQGSTSIGVWGGVYSPLGHDLDLGGVSGSVERRNSFAGGARLSLWGPGVLGLELVAGYTPASVDVAGGTLNGRRRLQIFTGGLKLLVGLSPRLSPVGLHVSAGPALIRRGHDVSNESESRTRLGGVIGAGLRFPFSRGLALRLEAENYIYRPAFEGNDDTVNDLILSAGLSLGF